MRSSNDADVDLALQVRELLGSLGAPALAPFLADWPERTARQTRRGSGAAAAPGRASAALPVLRCIRDVEDARDIFGAVVTRNLCRQAHALHWRQTYGAGEVAAGFLRNYGYTELLGPDAPWPAISISCGFLLLGVFEVSTIPETIHTGVNGIVCAINPASRLPNGAMPTNAMV